MILQKLPASAISKLKRIYNHSLPRGYFPDQLKKALLKFIPKSKSDTTNPMNIRAISLLQTTCKIVEKFLYNRVRGLLEEKQFYPNSKHGFRRKRGTDTTLKIFHETIAHQLPEKRQYYLVQRDINKAFDKVWHKRLKYKILHLNFPRRLTNILCNF